MSERDFQNISGPGRYQQDQLANTKPREPTFDELRNRNAPVTLPSGVYERLRAVEAAAREVAFQPYAPNDHMSACDRTMGDSHPCTCGANALRTALGNGEG